MERHHGRCAVGHLVRHTAELQGFVDFLLWIAESSVKSKKEYGKVAG